MLDTTDTTSNQRLLTPERGELERSGGEPNGGANNAAADSPAPDPEVSAKAQRRRFTAAYKARTAAVHLVVRQCRSSIQPPSLRVQQPTTVTRNSGVMPLGAKLVMPICQP